jgi:hypothetical protein
VPTEKTVAAMEATETERIEQAEAYESAVSVAEAFLPKPDDDVSGEDPTPTEETGG